MAKDGDDPSVGAPVAHLVSDHLFLKGYGTEQRISFKRNRPALLVDTAVAVVTFLVLRKD